MLFLCFPMYAPAEFRHFFLTHLSPHPGLLRPDPRVRRGNRDFVCVVLRSTVPAVAAVRSAVVRCASSSVCARFPTPPAFSAVSALSRPRSTSAAKRTNTTAAVAIYGFTLISSEIGARHSMQRRAID